MGREWTLQGKALLWAFFLFLDQGSKQTVLSLSSPWILCNAWGSWGVPLPRLLLLSGSILFLGFIAVYCWRRREFSIAALLLSVGATGNLLDRLLRGCVVDFIDIPFFPMFNLSDIFLTVGCLFFLFGDRITMNKEDKPSPRF